MLVSILRAVNGKAVGFTDIQGWKIGAVEAGAPATVAAAPAAAPAAMPGSVPPPPAVSFAGSEPSDDLPF